MSARAGLANIQRGDVGVRQAQQPQQQQGPSPEEVERYNAILRSEEFQEATPVQQAATIGSMNLSAEQRAPLMAAVRANMQQRRQTSSYNKTLLSEQFQVLTPEQQIAVVQSWNISTGQKAQLIEAIKPGSVKSSGPMPTEPFVTGGTETVQSETPMSLFGPKRSYYNPSTGVLTEELTTRQGEKIFIQVKPASTAEIFAGKAVLSPQTSMAYMGLSLVSVVAPAAAVPKVFGVGAAAGVSVGEAVKYGLTGEHLTVEEGIGAAGLGEIVALSAMGARAGLRSKTQSRVDAAYRRAVENQELYKPGVSDKILMKVTGAKPQFSQEIIGAGEPVGVSFKMLQQGRISAEAEDYLWNAPTPKTAQAYVRGYPSSKSWVETTLVKRLQLEGLFTLTVPTKLLMETEPKVAPKMPYIPSEPYLAAGTKVSHRSISSFAPFFALDNLQSNSTLQRQRQHMENIQATELLQEQTQMQKPVQMERQLQRQNQMALLSTRTVASTKTLVSEFDFKGKKFDFRPSIRRQRARGRKRLYPILTGEEVLKL